MHELVTINTDRINARFNYEIFQNNSVCVRLCVISVIRQGGSECYLKYCHMSRGGKLDPGKGGIDVLHM